MHRPFTRHADLYDCGAFSVVAELSKEYALVSNVGHRSTQLPPYFACCVPPSHASSR